MNPDPRKEHSSGLRRRLTELAAEIIRTEEELSAVETEAQLSFFSPGAPVVQIPETPAEKVALFLELFGTRRSVFPQRWENAKAGKNGYSPVCDNEWRAGICRKPQVKCTECPHQRFSSLDQRAVESHLRGERTLGVYAIGEDDTCRFLAADFDGEGWRDDVLAYREAAERVGITVAMERSRSGDGAHGWIFFAEPVPASLARKLGTILVAKATALRPTLGLGTYDRLFPNQDTLPVGGFGNLIALPLAKGPRQKGNTLFVDQHMKALNEQWEYLSVTLLASALAFQYDVAGARAVPERTLGVAPITFIGAESPWCVGRDRRSGRLSSVSPPSGMLHARTPGVGPN